MIALREEIKNVHSRRSDIVWAFAVLQHQPKQHGGLFGCADLGVGLASPFGQAKPKPGPLLGQAKLGDCFLIFCAGHGFVAGH